MGKGAIFNEYIRWETDQRAKVPNAELIRAVFERAISVWAQEAQSTNDGIKEATRKAAQQPKKKGKGKGKAEPEFDFAGETAKFDSYKLAEAEIWRQYAVWAVSPLLSVADFQDSTAVLERAVRACPNSGPLWTQLLEKSVSNSLSTADDRKQKLQCCI